MASDTRDADSEVTGTNPQLPQDEEIPKRRRRKAKHDFPQTQAGKLWDAFGNPDEPINTMPGGGYKTAGGRPKAYTWKDMVSLSKEDANRFWRTGCSRDALLVGIGGAGAVGGARFIWGGTVVEAGSSAL